VKRRRRRQLGDQIVNGTAYRDETDPRVINILEAARSGPDFAIRSTDVARGERICVRYGDTETGRDWGDPPMCGRIGRSQGTPGRDYTNRIPLLIKSKRSMGGEAILDHKIIRITRSAKPKHKHGVKYVLFEHPKYHYSEGEHAEQIEQIAKDVDKEARDAARRGDRPRAEELRVKAREIRRQKWNP
jgi:hypothetical protein